MSFRSRCGFRKAGNNTLTGVTRNKRVKIDEFEKEYLAFVEKLKQEDTTTETVAEEAAPVADIVEETTPVVEEPTLNEEIVAETPDIQVSEADEVADEIPTSKKKKKQK